MEYHVDHELPTLPMEMILEIIQCLAPDNPNEILSSTDDTTKTLLSFTRVCRRTYSTASKLLRQHCMLIDSNAKAKALAHCLTYPPPSFLESDSTSSTLARIENLFLGPFTELDISQEDIPEVIEISEDDQYDDTDWSDTSSDDYPPSYLNNLSTATDVRDILLAVAPTLRRLIIDMPLRSLYPEKDYQRVRPILRQGFEALVNLEEFSSIRDEMYMNIDSSSRDEPPVWSTFWPKLRRLSLYNVELAEDMWDQMADLPHLEMAIFPRADGDFLLSHLNIKQEWLLSLGQIGDPDEPEESDLSRSRDITIVLVDWAPEQPVFNAQFSQRWAELDPEDRIRILLADVTAPSVELDDPLIDPIELTQQFILQHALKGTLWEEEAMGMRKARFSDEINGSDIVV